MIYDLIGWYAVYRYSIIMGVTRIIELSIEYLNKKIRWYVLYGCNIITGVRYIIELSIEYLNQKIR